MKETEGILNASIEYKCPYCGHEDEVSLSMTDAQLIYDYDNVITCINPECNELFRINNVTE